MRIICAAAAFLSQLKSGRTSAPRLPQARAHKPRLDIRQPHVVGPNIAR
jgi:hypothetical protein